MEERECEQLVRDYVAWLRSNLSARSADGVCELTTPFLDRHNDHLQVFVQCREDEIVLSDDGYVFSELRSAGVDLTTPKRKTTIQGILNGFGVRKDGPQLVATASRENLPQRLHFFVQAMLSLNDMYVLAQPRVASIFQEDVRHFLDLIGARYSADVKLTGRSGFDHPIGFLIPKSAARPERLVQAINDPSKNTIAAYLFALSDTRDARAEQAEAYAFLNDKGKGAIPRDIRDALQHYNVTPVLWSNRDQVRQALAA